MWAEQKSNWSCTFFLSRVDQSKKGSFVRSLSYAKRFLVYKKREFRISSVYFSFCIRKGKMLDKLVQILKKRLVKLIRFSGGFNDPDLLDHFQEVPQEYCDAVLSDVYNSDCEDAERRGKLAVVIQKGDNGFLKREKEFQTNRIVLVYDIETICKDENDAEIDDVVVSISATVVRNCTIVDRFVVTFNVPEGLRNRSKRINRTEISNLYEEHIMGSFGVKFSKSDRPEVTVNLVETKNEAELITTWGRIIAAIKPHITVTFNGTSFDKPFLFRAGAKYGVDLPGMFSPLSPECKFLPASKFKPALREWQSEAPRFPYKLNGFIDNKCLELRHDSFLPGIHQDLYDYCNTSLDHAAEKFNVNIGKMGGVTFNEIPRLFHSKNPALLEYNVQDTEVTTELYFKLIFNAKIYYEELEKATGCPKESSASNNKSTPTKMMSYLANHRDCFVTDFGTNNKRETAVEVMNELNRYFFGGVTQFKHDLTEQLVREYHSGGVVLRKGWSNLSRTAHECKTTEDIDMVFRAMTNGPFYNTLQHLIFVSFVRHAGREVPIEGKYKTLMKDFVEFFEVKGNPAKRAELVEKECKKLAEFVYFVVITYGKFLSPFQNSDLLWETYSGFKSHSNVAVLRYFYDQYLAPGETISDTLYDVITDATRSYFSQWVDINVDDTAGFLNTLIEYHLPKRIKLEEKASSFDGGFTAKPVQQFSVDQPVFVVDIVSSYPNNIIKHNISAHTVVDYRFVSENGLEEGRHFDVINAKRSDDFVHYTEYLKRGLTYYVDLFYGFLLKADIAPSPFIKEYEGMLNARVVMKRSIATASNKDEAVDRKNKSDTMKVSINSGYGSMGLTFRNHTILAYVTASARRSILNSNKLLERIWGDGIRVVYNDTDSAFAQFLKPVKEFASMTVAELTEFFRGTGDTRLPVTEEFVTRIPLCKACYGEEVSVKLKPCGHIAACRSCSVDECPSCATPVKGTEIVEMTDRIKVCYLIDSVLNEYLIPALNGCNGKGRVIEFELEKAIVPYGQYTMKKYVGFKPLENSTISTGTSLARKSASGIQKLVMKLFLDSFCIGFANTGMVLLHLYHEIGSKLVKPLLEKTIDLKLVSKMATHNRAKNQTIKVLRMIKRMREDGFETPQVIKCREVCVEPIGDDEGWSYVTVEQFEKDPSKYAINCGKIMEEAMQELLAYLTIFTAKEAVWFEALCAGKYDPELAEITSGGCRYYSPTSVKKLNANTAQDYVTALMPILEKRAIQKSRVLPVSFLDKRKLDDKPKKGCKRANEDEISATPSKKSKTEPDSLMRPFVVHMKPEKVEEWIRQDPEHNIYAGPPLEGLERHPLTTPYVAKNFSEFYSCAIKYKRYINGADNRKEISKLKGKTIGCTCKLGEMWCCCEILVKTITAESSFEVRNSTSEDCGTICLDVDCISLRGTGTEKYMTYPYPYIERGAVKNNLAHETDRGTPGDVRFLPGEPNTFWLFTRWDTGSGKSMPRRETSTYKDTESNRRSWLIKCLTKLGEDERCGNVVTFVCSLELDEAIVRAFTRKYGKKVTLVTKV